MSKLEPSNLVLWKRAHKEADKIYSKPSAYKSGFIVKYYKNNGGKFASAKQKNDGLSRWYKEKWTNQHGTVGYKHKDDIYRPSIRVSKNTPVTWKELSKKRITKAKRSKSKTGRVKKF